MQDASDKLKNTLLGSPVTEYDVRQLLDKVVGGLAMPGKNPGFAIVAGLRQPPPYTSKLPEIYILDERELPDMQALLRQCRALGSQYNIDLNGAFQWFGDGGNTSVQAIVCDLNREHRAAHPPAYHHRDDLTVLTTPLLDWDTPYPAMLGQLKDCLRPDHKLLYLRGSKVTQYMDGIKPDEHADLRFGAYPAIEALSFAVKALRSEAEYHQWQQQHEHEKIPHYEPADYLELDGYDPTSYV